MLAADIRARDYFSRPITVVLDDIERSVVGVQRPPCDSVGMERDRPFDATDDGPGSDKVRLKRTSCFSRGDDVVSNVSGGLAAVRQGEYWAVGVLWRENGMPHFLFVISMAQADLRVARGCPQ